MSGPFFLWRWRRLRRLVCLRRLVEVVSFVGIPGQGERDSGVK